MESYKTPLEMFYHWETVQPDQVFLRQPILNNGWQEFIWREVGIQVRAMACHLKEKYPANSCIVILSQNCAHWFMSDLAIMLAGHISVPLYANQHADTLEYVLNHCEAKAIFIGPLEDWAQLSTGIPNNIEKIALPYDIELPESNQWHYIVQNNEPISENRVPDLDDIMTIMYTSGTTGHPKGVMHSYKNASFAETGFKSWFECSQQDTFFSYLPLCHVAERYLVELLSIYCGGTVSFNESIEKFGQRIQEVSPSFLIAVPRILTKIQMGVLAKIPSAELEKQLSDPTKSEIVKESIQKNMGMNNLRIFIAGAAPVAPDMLKWYEALGITIQEGYAQTENCAYCCFNPKNDIRIGTVGPTPHNSTIKISDQGEVLVKNSAIMVGYYKEPELTKAVFTEDGFLRTGDLGNIDQSGYLTITGRLKELFKTAKAKYVAPVPIENKLLKNTLIEQICVMGSGLTQPIALIVLSETAKTNSQEWIDKNLKKTLERVNSQLENHEKVSQIILLKEPWSVENDLLTPTFKIKRFNIEKKYQKLVEVNITNSKTIVWEKS